MVLKEMVTTMILSISQKLLLLLKNLRVATVKQNMATQMFNAEMVTYVAELRLVLVYVVSFSGSL